MRLSVASWKKLGLGMAFFISGLAVAQGLNTTDSSLDQELGTAEKAAGGQHELKANGLPAEDALGIPQETAQPAPAPAPPAASKPAPKVAQPEPAPAPPAPAPAPTEEAPPPASEAPPPAAEPEAQAPQAETPAPQDQEVQALEEEKPAEEPSPATPAPAPAPKAVPVENKKICECRYKLGTPYRDRRGPITGIFGIEAGAYAPTNYKPRIVAGQTYSNFYGGNANPNVEVVFGAKWNFLLGSLGLQASGGYFSATNQGTGAGFGVIPVTAGLIYSLDSLFPEPYIVPYVVGGAYTDFYKENAGGLTYSGRTTFAPFYAMGVLLQLDWIDQEAHDSGYKDFGIENTFLFVEARSFMSSNDTASDLSTPLQLSGGLKFEF